MNLIKSIWQDIQEIKSTRKELKEFGMVMGVFFGLISGLLLWKGKNYLPFGIASAIFLAVTFINPFWLKGPQKIWMSIAVTIGWFMSRLILGFVFFCVITPLSFLMRLCGKNFLDLEFKKSTDSYWIPKPSEPLPKERYEKQF
jgi:hypothetical protein